MLMEQMHLIRERRAEDGISKVFRLRKWEDRVVTNGMGGEAEAGNSLLDRLSLKFLSDIQVELLDIEQAGRCTKEFRNKVWAGYTVSEILKCHHCNICTPLFYMPLKH